MKDISQSLRFGLLFVVASFAVGCSTPKQMQNASPVVGENVPLVERPSIILASDGLESLDPIAEFAVEEVPPIVPATEFAETDPSLPSIPQPVVDPLLLVDENEESVVALNQVPEENDSFAISSERVDPDAWRAILNARESSGLKEAGEFLKNNVTSGP